MLDASLLPLRNDQAVLRTMLLGDAAPYSQGTTDTLVRQYGHLPEPEYTEESVIELINGSIREGLERGDLAVLTIADPATDAFAGSLVLFGVEHGQVEVGFWVRPESRGRGIICAALALAAEFSRRSGLSRITARTAPENRASQRVLERSGFTETDRSRDTAPSGEEVILQHYRRDLTPITLFPLDTERLRLRLHEHADTEALHRIYRRPDVARYLLDEPWSDTDAARHLGERVAKTGPDSETGALAVVIEHEGMLLGDVQLWLTDRERGVAEIGWVLDPAHGGRGFMTEAVGAVLRIGFNRYGLHRIVAHMDARNDSSARLAQRVGMRREAHLRQDWWNKGEWTDTLIFGSLAADESIYGS